MTPIQTLPRAGKYLTFAVAQERYSVPVLKVREIMRLCPVTPVPRMRYRVGVPQAGPWRELLNTDQAVYGGSGLPSAPGVTEALPWQQRPQSLCLDLPPLACIVLQPVA